MHWLHDAPILQWQVECTEITFEIDGTLHACIPYDWPQRASWSRRGMRRLETLLPCFLCEVAQNVTRIFNAHCCAALELLHCAVAPGANAVAATGGDGVGPSESVAMVCK